MRPPRVVLAAAFFITAVLWMVLSARSVGSSETFTTSSNLPQKTGIQTLFSFRTPFSLFPPNAIITLTHDNTTAFLARPAGFGPLLPTRGLKGQVWIGSGFGDAAAGGELGCSDMPGWEGSYAKSGPATYEGGFSNRKSGTAPQKPPPQRRRSRRSADGVFEGKAILPDDRTEKNLHARPSTNDGTDDYLHHPLSSSTVTKLSENQRVEATEHHADIQSIQEGAEIAGKVVLLSRGGCGFLEKVKWAQRRGAVALIVGDDKKGEPLIQMYARGDTSNVSIPSVFTSYTTAHLLSSLVGPGSFIEDIIDDDGNPALRVDHSQKSRRKGADSHQTFTPTSAVAKSTSAPRSASKTTGKRRSPSKTERETQPLTTERPGWFKSLFLGSRGSSQSGSSRPPSSGQLDWVLVEEWKDEDEQHSRKISTKTNQKSGSVQKSDPKSSTGLASTVSQDDFVIGVQDWRDPDLRITPGQKEEGGNGQSLSGVDGKESKTTTKNTSPKATQTGGKKHLGGALQEIPEYHPSLAGNSITPGSGEYPAKDSEGNPKMEVESKQSLDAEPKSKGLLTTIFGDDEEDVEFLTPVKRPSASSDVSEEQGDDENEGLWVTITPTSSASPFLDTLLVLVVSPLVTLTVVYALLLIRSRIRRRRWRAPKSVVERLPVRTYQTIVSPGTQSPRLPSPTSSSATTPLLQTSTPNRPRPRSRTSTGVPEHNDMIRVSSAPLQVPTISLRTQDHEKNASESSEWKNHMNKQVECVICLEDYIEGVSRVMSLPCGHEFHADCITPWLTTRRRTCPICKGDVVRSLARGSPSTPQYEAYHDDSDDDIQIQAAETINNSSSSALPIDGGYTDEDLEQGNAQSSQPRRTNHASSWRNLLASSFGSRSRSPRPQEEDRDR